MLDGVVQKSASLLSQPPSTFVSASEVARMEDYLYYLILGLVGCAALICVLLLIFVLEISPKVIKMIRRWRGKRRKKRGRPVRFQKQSPVYYSVPVVEKKGSTVPPKLSVNSDGYQGCNSIDIFSGTESDPESGPSHDWGF